LVCGRQLRPVRLRSGSRVMIKNEAPARFRAMLSCGRIKITTGVLPVSTSSTMRRSLWLILPSASTTLAMMGSRLGPSGRGPVSELASPEGPA
jgi:hypothetical protein